MRFPTHSTASKALDTKVAMHNPSTILHNPSTIPYNPSTFSHNPSTLPSLPTYVRAASTPRGQHPVLYPRLYIGEECQCRVPHVSLLRHGISGASATIFADTF